MSRLNFTRIRRIIPIMALFALWSGVPVVAQDAPDPVLLLQLSDTAINAAANEGWISVYLANYQDDVAGFSLAVTLDRPDVIELVSDEIDTAGTMISGWEFVQIGSYAPGLNVKVVALADYFGSPVTPPLYPTSTPGLLCRLKYRVNHDNVYAYDQTVTLHILENLEQTAFTDPYGNLIGTTTIYSVTDTMYLKCLQWADDSCLGWIHTTPAEADTVIFDTIFHYWNCVEWSGDECLSWAAAAGPPADSVSIDSVAKTILDTTVVTYIDGHVSVSYESCCDVPGDVNSDGIFNVGDAVALINHIFKQGPLPACPPAADTNGDCTINIGDAVRMICNIFGICPDPVCSSPDCPPIGP